MWDTLKLIYEDTSDIKWARMKILNYEFELPIFF